jgi:Phage tail tube protein
MTDYAQGMKEALYLGLESSFKVMPTTVNGVKVPVINPSLKPSRNTFTSQALTGSPEPRPIRFGKTGCDGSFTIEGSQDSLATPLYGMFGAADVSGTTGFYDHIFTMDNPKPMWFEEQHTDISQYAQANGMYIGSAAFNLAAEGLMQVAFTAMGAKYKLAASSFINGTSVDQTGDLPLSYLYNAVEIGGSANGILESLTLNVNRNLGKQSAMDATNELAVIFSQIASVSGTIKALFTDETVMNYGLNGTETSLRVFIPAGSGLGMVIYMPTVVFSPGSITTNGTGLCSIDGNFTAYARGSASDIAPVIRSKWFETVTIGSGTTDSFKIKVDGASAQGETLTAGASQTPEDIQTDLAGLTGCVVSLERQTGETGARVVITDSAKGSSKSLQIDATGTAQTVLGFDTTAHDGYDAKSIVITLMNAASSIST